MNNGFLGLEVSKFLQPVDEADDDLTRQMTF